MKTYALYDTQDNDCLRFVGTSKEVAQYLNTNVNVIYSIASKKSKVENRYELIVIKEEL